MYNLRNIESNELIKIAKVMDMYAYLVLADLEEILLAKIINQAIILEVIKELESILKRHRHIAINSLYNSISLKEQMIKW